MDPLGRSGTPMSQEECREIKTLLGRGMRPERLARTYRRRVVEVLSIPATPHRPTPRPHWSESELEDLRRLAESGETDAAIAEQLNRPERGVAERRRQLGIHRPKAAARATPATPWSERELTLLREMYPTKTDEQIATEIRRSIEGANRSSRAVALMRRKLRLSRMPANRNSNAVETMHGRRDEAHSSEPLATRRALDERRGSARDPARTPRLLEPPESPQGLVRTEHATRDPER